MFLPKFGWVKFRMARPLGGRVKSATVTRDGKHWFISFLIDDGLAEVSEHARPGRHVGVDRGVVTAAVTSEGEFFDRRHAGESGVSSMAPPPVGVGEGAGDTGFLTAGEARRYIRLQRRLARSKKGSNRRRGVVRAMGDLMRRARWRRADFNAQVAYRLTRDYAIVTLERLNIRAMTASVAPKPDPGMPGAYLSNRRAAKAGLNKSILDKGWYGLETGHAAGLVVSGRGDPPGSVKRQAPCTTVRGAGDAPRTAA
ncbi:RNA-guided endonuclease InsQ/TnpB family protein [Nonomuraea sp. NPDC003201]